MYLVVVVSVVQEEGEGEDLVADVEDRRVERHLCQVEVHLLPRQPRPRHTHQAQVHADDAWSGNIITSFINIF